MSNRERIGANNATIQACIDKANALPNASGGGGLTPSEGLSFEATYSYQTFYCGRYGVNGLGTCTDEVVVVPCTTPNGDPVTDIGVVQSSGGSVGMWIQDVKKLYLPDTVTLITFSGFTCGNMLEYIKFGKYLSTVDGFQWADGGAKDGMVLDFSEYRLSTPPALSDRSLFSHAAEIRVPAAMVDTWKSATNWAAAADIIVGV